MQNTRRDQGAVTKEHAQVCGGKTVFDGRIVLMQRIPTVEEKQKSVLKILVKDNTGNLEILQKDKESGMICFVFRNW